MRVEQRQENGLTRFVLYKEALWAAVCAAQRAAVQSCWS